MVLAALGQQVEEVVGDAGVVVHAAAVTAARVAVAVVVARVAVGRGLVHVPHGTGARDDVFAEVPDRRRGAALYVGLDGGAEDVGRGFVERTRFVAVLQVGFVLGHAVAEFVGRDVEGAEVQIGAAVAVTEGRGAARPEGVAVAARVVAVGRGRAATVVVAGPAELGVEVVEGGHAGVVGGQQIGVAAVADGGRGVAGAAGEVVGHVVGVFERVGLEVVVLVDDAAVVGVDEDDRHRGGVGVFDVADADAPDEVRAAVLGEHPQVGGGGFRHVGASADGGKGEVSGFVGGPQRGGVDGDLVLEGVRGVEQLAVGVEVDDGFAAPDRHAGHGLLVEDVAVAAGVEAHPVDVHGVDAGDEVGDPVELLCGEVGGQRFGVGVAGEDVAITVIVGAAGGEGEQGDQGDGRDAERHDPSGVRGAGQR